MILRHSAPREIALGQLSGAGARSLFDKYAAAEMHGFGNMASPRLKGFGLFDYTPCKFEIQGQMFFAKGCSEYTLALTNTENLLCEASKAAGLNQQDPRYLAAYELLNRETSLTSRSAVTVGSACVEAVTYANNVNEGLKKLLVEAGSPSQLNPPPVTPPSSNIIPREFMVAGGIALGILAFVYLGPAIRTASSAAASRMKK